MILNTLPGDLVMEVIGDTFAGDQMSSGDDIGVPARIAGRVLDSRKSPKRRQGPA